MSRARSSISLRSPPDDPAALDGFPRKRLEAKADLYRLAREGRSPWWFGSSGEGRFDLPPPHGTCYLAADPIGALLEVVGPDGDGGAVSARFLADRILHRLHAPAELRVADLTSRRASRFGITAEIGTLVPYDLPQAWAARLHAAGCEGLAYWLRHDPAHGEGVALFGREGKRDDWPAGEEIAVGPELLARLRDECGIEVAEVPRAGELRILRQAGD